MVSPLRIRGGIQTNGGWHEGQPLKSSNVLLPKTAPITRLPNELLTSVFAMVADLEEPKSFATLFGLPDGPRTYMKWVKLMLVCWHWYIVGHSSPSLWRRISVTSNLKSLDFRLSRTAGCTIDAFVRQDAATNKSAMPFLIPFASRIRSIQLVDLFWFDSLPSIKPLFEAFLPSLESVTLLSGQPIPSPVDVDSPDESKGWFDLGLSEDLHPRVRKLEMHRIVIPSSSAFFSTLRDLVIDLKGLKNPPLCPKDIVNVLAHSPHLEVLRIFSSHTWTYASGSEVPADAELGRRSRQSLLNLREIYLSCPYRFAALILQTIDAPNLGEFRVEASTSIPVVVDNIGSDILPPSLRHIVPRFSKLRLIPNRPSGFYIGGSASLVPGSRYRSGDRNCFRVDIAVRDSSSWVAPSLDPALTTLCNVFAGVSLEQLEISGFDDIPSPSAWKRLYTTFPSIASLRVTCSASVVVSFLHAFRTSSREGLWLPLRRLCVDTAHQDYEPLDSFQLYVILELVLDVLRARRGRDVNTILSLEHAIKRWTPLFPHRWMLRTIASLCGDTFRFRRCEDDALRSRIEIRPSELFMPVELRRMSVGSEEAEEMSDEGEEGAEVEETGGADTSTNVEGVPLNVAKTVGICADECEKLEVVINHVAYSMHRSKVLEELRKTVPKTV